MKCGASSWRRVIAPGLIPNPCRGADWRQEMETAIGAADALVVLLTADAAASIAVTYEWAYALGAGLPVFALIYEEAPEHPRLQLVNRYDARSFGDENHFWDHFLEGFIRHLERAEAQALAARPATTEALEIDKSVMPTAPGYWLAMAARTAYESAISTGARGGEHRPRPGQ